MGTIIVGIIVLTLVILSAWKLIDDKKNNKTCGGCNGCGKSGCGTQPGH